MTGFGSAGAARIMPPTLPRVVVYNVAKGSRKYNIIFSVFALGGST